MNPKSKKPRKQRTFWLHLPLHLKQKSLSIHLSEVLRKELKKRNMPVRKGDTVKIVRGSFWGKTGKITGVNYRDGVVFIEKILRKKSDGKEVQVSIRASNLVIMDLNREDEARFGKKPQKGKPKPKKEVSEEKDAKKDGKENEKKKAIEGAGTRKRKEEA